MTDEIKKPDLGFINDVCERASWVLEEADTYKVSFDDFKHKDHCWLGANYLGDPTKSPEERAKYLEWGCDKTCVQEFVKSRGLTFVKKYRG